MHFEKALSNFIAEIKQYHGYEAKIKSMELSEDLYRRLEFELREKSLWQPEIPEPRVIQFYSHGDMIRLHKTKPQPEKPQRKIVQLIKTDEGWFSLANTGECFYLVRPLDRECHWVRYPDLPQD